MDTVHKWLLDNRISEVEVLVPDMTGNARGKILEHLGLRAEPLPTLRAQAPPVTLELFPAA